MRLPIILSLFLILLSCAKKTEDQILEAIDLAYSYIDSSECQEAIDVLEDVGRQNDHALYLQALASSYACRGGYNTISFVSDDIPNIDATSAGLLTSLSILSLSAETEADSSEYADLLIAWNILLDLDESEPSQATRNASFGSHKGGDMGILSLFLGLTQLGKFLHYYGNVDAAGVKGGGSGTSTCFIDYTDVRATAFITGGGGGACSTATGGHADLSTAAADLDTTKRRLCEGLMFVTNIIDILNNIEIGDNSSMGDLENAAASVNTMRDFVTGLDPALATLLDTTSQEACETLVAGASEFNNLQYIYALFFEKGLP